jgi:hypothetical protein
MLVSSIQVSIQKAIKIALVAFNATKPIPQQDIATKACHADQNISSHQLKTITA